MRLTFTAFMAAFLCIATYATSARVAAEGKPGTVFKGPIPLSKWCWSQEAWAAIFESYYKGGAAASNAKSNEMLLAGKCVNATGQIRALMKIEEQILVLGKEKMLVVRGTGARFLTPRLVAPFKRPVYAAVGCSVFKDPAKDGPEFCAGGKPAKAPKHKLRPGEQEA